jgi:hypothetical protein
LLPPTLSDPSPDLSVPLSKSSRALWVDRNGNVTRAEAGDRGTTNAAKCLATQAVIAAKKTKWQPSENAAETQVGRIIYNFSLN